MLNKPEPRRINVTMDIELLEVTKIAAPPNELLIIGIAGPCFCKNNLVLQYYIGLRLRLQALRFTVVNNQCLFSGLKKVEVNHTQSHIPNFTCYSEILIYKEGHALSARV